MQIKCGEVVDVAKEVIRDKPGQGLVNHHKDLGKSEAIGALSKGPFWFLY